MDIDDDDGYLSLLDSSGTPKDDVKLPDGDLGKQLKAAFSEEEKEYNVTIISAMGEEAVISFKEAPKNT